MKIIEYIRGNYENVIFKTVLGIFLVIGLYIFCLDLYLKNVISMNGFEIPQISHNGLIVYLLFLVGIIVFILIQPILRKIDPKIILIVCVSIFTVLGMYLALFADDHLRGSNPNSVLRVDQGSCVTIARHLNSGDFSDFRLGGYLHMYPYQIYWIMLLRVFLKINDSVRFLYIFMLLISILIMIANYFLVKSLSKDKAVLNSSTLLAFLFLPNLFNVLFVYPNSVAYLLFVLGFYVYLRSFKNQKLQYLSVICFCMAALLKNNYLIGVIAFLIVVFISNIKWKKKFILLLISILFINVSNISVQKYFSHASHTNFSMKSGMPTPAFILMGLSGDGLRSGWWNGITVFMYEHNHYSSSETKKVATKALDERLHYLKNNPNDLKGLLENKIISTWTDTTYQSLWNAPTPYWGGKFNTKTIRRIYTEGTKTQKIIFRISLMSVLSIFLGSIVWTIKNLKLTNKWQSTNTQLICIFSSLFFLGGFTFHLFWETKSQYVWQYVMFLIPVASLGINSLYAPLRDLLGKTKILNIINAK
ncbi:MAG: hypothetical protein Q3959_01345 [Limosilactobacillus sp.]|uniref:hypothetical protein n=1 Tax=Limosilactobacillus sp. TaxID=2773925 RepID=UPI0027091775|nr:hypothetical protein [Limosilactobacillus sp.]